jgi:hypothetical protein
MLLLLLFTYLTYRRVLRPASFVRHDINLASIPLLNCDAWTLLSDESLPSAVRKIIGVCRQIEWNHLPSFKSSQRWGFSGTV